MDIRITPGPLAGTVTPPPSKSIAHRAILAAALTNGTSTIQNVALSQDIEATLRCITALGGAWEREGDTLYVSGVWHREWDTAALPHLDCGESGSTLRFLIPLAVTLNNGGVFTGRGRLMERPQGVYRELFLPRGIRWEQSGDRLTLQGRLAAGKFSLPGGVSSQFVTGLLYALPLLEGDSEIRLTSPLESRGYVDMTLAALAAFGVSVTEIPNGFRTPGGQRYRPRAVSIEADWSQAAFWSASMALGHPVEPQGLNPASAQGDMCIVSYCQRLRQSGDAALDVSGCPDLAPPLAVIAALRSEERTSLTGAARLRIKESDRLAAITRVLCAMGADVEEGPDFLRIRGRDSLAGGCTVDCCNDHRIAMMAAVAATRCREPVTLLGAECVAKSYPAFWDDYKSLGGQVYEYPGE